jgi:FMN phosphatase YigB (HAD superfamily)
MTKGKKLLVCDLDGTLYYQIPVRILMAVEILLYYLLRLWRWRELYIILRFRRIHNHHDIFTISEFAEKMKVTTEQVESLVQKWMFVRPLKWIKLFADKKLCNLLNNCKTVILSDYATENKMSVLSLRPEACFYYDDRQIKKMKPAACGLQFIAQKYGVAPADILMIGDDLAKDGKCAQNFGCEFIIIKKWPWLRRKQYREIENVLQDK